MLSLNTRTNTQWEEPFVTGNRKFCFVYDVFIGTFDLLICNFYFLGLFEFPILFKN